MSLEALKAGIAANKAVTAVGAIVLAKTLYDAVGLFRKKEDEQGNPIHRNGILTTATEGVGLAAITKALIDSNGAKIFAGRG